MTNAVFATIRSIECRPSRVELTDRYSQSQRYGTQKLQLHSNNLDKYVYMYNICGKLGSLLENIISIRLEESTCFCDSQFSMRLLNESTLYSRRE